MGKGGIHRWLRDCLNLWKEVLHQSLLDTVRDPVNLNVRVILLKLVIESCHDVNLLDWPRSKSAYMAER